MSLRIAALLTCFNRKDKTISCLKTLFCALDNYNRNNLNNVINLTVFLVDDGSTDGTSEAICEKFCDRRIKILQGTGSLFWAGGMRFAWKTAMESESKWDYYLLINDDTDILDNLFFELLSTEAYSIKETGKTGLVSGITSSKTEPFVLTYGGEVWSNKFLGTKLSLGKSETPQQCDLTNANILLVPSEIVGEIGGFYEGYIHGAADYDYANMVKKAGYPVWVTANYCGRCDRDHENHKAVYEKTLRMTIAQRKEYYNHPLHSLDQNLTYAKRVTPFRVPIVKLGNFLHIYFPSILYYIGKFRF